MSKPERRKRRSEQTHLALNLYLEAIREREGFKALAVTTDDGFLVAGAAGSRDCDVEWMGALGASARRQTLEWDNETLHVHRVHVNSVPMFVTAMGRKANTASMQSGLERILSPLT
jgi:hypothetical protein